MHKIYLLWKNSTGGVFLRFIYNWKSLLAGTLAGAVSGLFGAGGGMVLVPLLTFLATIQDSDIFSTSVSIILPVCVVSLLFSLSGSSVSWISVLPYIIGSVLGGIGAGIWGKRIPTVWLHRGLGIFILWGGIRYLC